MKFRESFRLKSVGCGVFAGIFSNHIIEVSRHGKIVRLRRIGYCDAESGKHYEFLTNHFRLAARTIADICQDRWMIEIFYREIKKSAY